MLIKNFDSLATTPERKIVLEIIEAGLESIQPEKIFDELRLEDYALETYDRVFLLGFGKGSAGVSKIVESRFSNLKGGWVIDVVPETFTKIKSTIGTHPLPSETNVEFTKNALSQLNHLTPKDLVLVVICGGGSALFTLPSSLPQLINVNQELLKSGANISEMNTIRKHLDSVKGGGLAKMLFPARILSLILSDVPGNDPTIIASGPTAKDPSTQEDAAKVVEKYHLTSVKPTDFSETPKEAKYFENVTNIILLSNLTALKAMKATAEGVGLNAEITSDRLQGEAREAGPLLLDKTPSKSILLSGGETTVTVKSQGLGGRNQELVLGALAHLDSHTVVASIDSDGWDNSSAAGAIGDTLTVQKAKDLGLSPDEYLEKNDSFNFFQKVGDAIETGRLPSNTADLIVVLKNG